MTRLYHQDNFATNITSNQVAGVTTTPLNSIPSVSAPFRIALDALNINGKYEVVTVTSKTATHILHAATAYEHTTAETVSLIVDADEMDEISAAINGEGPLAVMAPQGFLINGKISVTDTGSGLTVAVKTLAGTDASSSSPIYVRIGDTVRSITAALSVTKADGTNWCNAGSAELATKEIDYFVYLGYNATDGVVIGFSRIPGANSYDDFSATTTNEKYCAISTITNAAATDYYEVIGRFAATLSAGAGYTWSVPTYTAKNLIQRPIYESRWLDWVPTWSGGSPSYGDASLANKYLIRYSDVQCEFSMTMGSSTTYGSIDWSFSSPMTAKTENNSNHRSCGSCHALDTGTAYYSGVSVIAQNTNAIALFSSAATGNSWKNNLPHIWVTNDYLSMKITYKI